MLCDLLLHCDPLLLHRQHESMEYKYQETVEVIIKLDGVVVVYFPAKILAAVGKNRYIVKSITRLTEDGKRFLTTALDSSDIRPVPPNIGVKNFKDFDRVDVYDHGGWWAGRIARKADPNYFVKLDKDGSEVHSWFYNVRCHLDLVDDKWIYPKVTEENDRSHKDEVAGPSMIKPS